MFSQKMMENLINDLLDLAKIENDSFNISSEYFDLGSLIFEAFHMMAYKAADAKVSLTAEIDEKQNLDLLANIYGDQRRFLQILSNFLSNSLKFTNPGGKITVKLQVLGKQVIKDSESYISLKLSVDDTGIGMSEEGVKGLFIDFGRLAENEGRNKSGTGLGLSICKQIIEKMGGSVDVKSQLGVGSQFIINLKLKCKCDAKPE